MRSWMGIAMALLLGVIVAGCARGGAQAPAPPAAESGRRAEIPTVGVVLREFEFEPRPLKVKAGTVRFELINRGAVATLCGNVTAAINGERSAVASDPSTGGEVLVCDG